MVGTDWRGLLVIDQKTSKDAGLLGFLGVTVSISSTSREPIALEEHTLSLPHPPSPMMRPFRSARGRVELDVFPHLFVRMIADDDVWSWNNIMLGCIFVALFDMRNGAELFSRLYPLTQECSCTTDERPLLRSTCMHIVYSSTICEITLFGVGQEKTWKFLEKYIYYKCASSYTYMWGRGGVVVRLRTFHQGEPDSIPGEVAPGFSNVGIVPDDVAGRLIFSGISRLLHSQLTSLSPALKTSMLRVTLNSLTHIALDKIIVHGYKALQLQYFFTCGPDEVKAWTIQLSLTPEYICLWGRDHGGVVARLLASHLGDQGSIPGGVATGFPQVGIVPDDATGRRAFSGSLVSPRTFIPALPHSQLASPSSVFKTLVLNAARLSSLTVFGGIKITSIQLQRRNLYFTHVISHGPSPRPPPWSRL
ncbi:hypothetical protein PR048_026022 [Dryococelus australis]|uniref:Uncharacterized protein n=1 Tax=Dryococelus australis TaxID=614101 RepID=A0ABQ9GK59_9NEOP|nr:hypothetical protein PR048_026022 [Dryococelus australis]